MLVETLFVRPLYDFFFDILTKHFISYFHALLNKLFQNNDYNWHHWVRLKKHSSNAFEAIGRS